jgi:hypothetical protein
VCTRALYSPSAAEPSLLLAPCCGWPALLIRSFSLQKHCEGRQRRKQLQLWRLPLQTSKHILQ